MKHKNLWLAIGVGALTIFVLSLFNKKKMKPIILKGGYIVPKGTPNMADALHSFEKRKSDGFGGLMSTKIKAKLRETRTVFMLDHRNAA